MKSLKRKIYEWLRPQFELKEKQQSVKVHTFNHPVQTIATELTVRPDLLNEKDFIDHEIAKKLAKYIVKNHLYKKEVFGAPYGNEVVIRCTMYVAGDWLDN